MKKLLHLFYVLFLPVLLSLVIVKVSAAGPGNSESEPTLSIHLLSEEKVSLDAVRAIFADRYSATVCDDDSYKLSNPGENMAIVREGKLLSIESRPSIAKDTTLLRMWKLKSRKYYLKITASSFPTLVTASLHDSRTNKEISLNLSSTTIISFENTDGTDATNRFSIVSQKAGLLPVMLTDVKAYQKFKGIQVDWKVQGETNILKYDVEKSNDGQQFAAVTSIEPTVNNGTAHTYSFYDARTTTGSNFYRVKVTEKSGSVMYSTVLKVAMSQNNSSISVSPNPVKGSIRNLHVNDFEPGTYSISVYNAAGLQQDRRLIEHPGGSATYSLSTINNFMPGLYSVHITKGEMVVNRMIVVQ